MRKKQPADDKPVSIDQAKAKIAKAMSDLAEGDDPGTVSLRIKHAKKSVEIYPLKLTWHQRESMIHCTRIENKLKEKLKDAGEGTLIVGVTRKELDHLNEELGEAVPYAPHPDKKRLVAVQRKVAELFAEDRAGLFTEKVLKARKTDPKKGDLVYQFKITLLEIKPAIWRRVQVSDCTLGRLHEYIQAAMGWTNSHLHQFDIKGERYGDPELLDDGFEDFKCVDSTKTNLSQIIPKTGKRSAFRYEYDFGDGWEHEVLFEGFPPNDPKAKCPLCVEGARACPPEDCGGPSGYSDYLAAIADPNHEQHDEMMEWRGPFDPEAFDPKKATKEMRKVK